MIVTANLNDVDRQAYAGRRPGKLTECETWSHTLSLISRGQTLSKRSGWSSSSINWSKVTSGNIPRTVDGQIGVDRHLADAAGLLREEHFLAPIRAENVASNEQ